MPDTEAMNAPTQTRARALERIAWRLADDNYRSERMSAGSPNKTPFNNCIAANEQTAEALGIGDDYRRACRELGTAHTAPYTP